MLTEYEQLDLMVVNFVLFRNLPNPKPIVVSREHQLPNPAITSDVSFAFKSY